MASNSARLFCHGGAGGGICRQWAGGKGCCVAACDQDRELSGRLISRNRHYIPHAHLGGLAILDNNMSFPDFRQCQGIVACWCSKTSVTDLTHGKMIFEMRVLPLQKILLRHTRAMHAVLRSDPVFYLCLPLFAGGLCALSLSLSLSPSRPV